MKKVDAIKLRDENREKLVGKPFDGNTDGWNIKDIIISDNSNVGKIYARMWESNITNDLALGFFSINEEDYNVYIISHQWPWGSGNLLFQRIESYYTNNPH